MMVWSLTLLPVLAGGLLWRLGMRIPVDDRSRVLGIGAVATLVTTLIVAVVAAKNGSRGTYAVGAGIELQVGLDAPAHVVAVLVPAIAAIVVAYAASHEPSAELPRLVGLLTVFAGVMLLLVTAEDLLTLVVAFELVGALSWALIGHHWRDAHAPGAAAHAFNVTRAGGLGLFLAAGAAFASTGSLAYGELSAVSGAAQQVVVAGVLVAAVAKSAQGPFAPWLFSAMAGPTPVSALLHSSTMVAAGAYVLARLHPVLDQAGWFGPATITVGLVTALAGGVVALLQPDAKKLLAASTSAQYGLMFVAVGAGYPAVAIVHLVVHAVFKSQLFLAAGVATDAVGSRLLGDLRLGRRLRSTATMAAVGSLALAAVPPLGGAFSKEQVVAAAGHETAWLAALVIAAGGLSAAYATRFQLLAFGSLRGEDPPSRPPIPRPPRVVLTAIGLLAAASLGLGVLWMPSVHEAVGPLLGGQLPTGTRVELVASVVLVVAAVYAVWSIDRQHRLGSLGTTGPLRAAADWLGWPLVVRRLVVDPSLRLAVTLARLDDRVIDGGVAAIAAGGRGSASRLADRVEPRIDGVVGAVAGGGRLAARGGTRVVERAFDGVVAAAAWIVDGAADDARRIQTGMVHHQFVVIALGLALIAAAALTGR